MQTSLLCGENLQTPPWRRALVDTSLIHLFVVSGSHLILLEQILLFLRCPLFVRVLLWILYALLCGWQPPLVRALVCALGRNLEHRTGLFWPRDISILICGLSVLLLFPSWVESRSLLMSWAAALALSASTLWEKRAAAEKFLLAAGSVYLAMLPLLWGFGSLHPLAIPYNLFLGFFVSLWLWPLAFFCLLFPTANPVLEASARIFLRVLQLFSDPILIQNAAPLDLHGLWFFLLGLHAAVHFARLSHRRRQI